MNKLLLIVIILLIIIVYFYYNKFKIILINFLTILRGIITINCKWWNISEKILDDNSGINLYNYYKNINKNFVAINMFGEKIYLVTNNKYQKIILENSPNTFNVGNLKYKFFKSFMAKNVGVSSGCPWLYRRYLNEQLLNTNNLHCYSEKYNNDVKIELELIKKKSNINFNDFLSIGRKMTLKIVFNVDKISPNVLNIFSEANSIYALLDPNFKVDKFKYNDYYNSLMYYIEKPREQSLINIGTRITQNKNELFHQIPHFIFPIIGLYAITIPRLILLLSNHTNYFRILINEIYSIQDNYQYIYQLNFLRKCILETLRLNNPVITTFRTLTKNFKFDKKYKFKKGTQFLILNNAVLRDSNFFKNNNKFNPLRWNLDLEDSYYAISFNQGPQKCPGKELAIYLIQSFIYNFIKIFKIGKENKIVTNQINTNNISQAINTCNIKFKIISIN